MRSTLSPSSAASDVYKRQVMYVLRGIRRASTTTYVLSSYSQMIPAL